MRIFGSVALAVGALLLALPFAGAFTLGVTAVVGLVAYDAQRGQFS